MNEKWSEWNLNGFIPGPEESEAEYTRRVEYCSHLEQELAGRVGAELPFELGDPHTTTVLQEGLERTKRLYGIAPKWVPLFFSNYQLNLWHGGCAWIFQLNDQTPMAAFLQLRSRFNEHASYLGIYDRQELIAHELAHVGRMMYNDPQFEELFAYQSSKHSWRRYLGPIIRSSKESLFFIILLGLYLITHLALMSVNPHLTEMVMLGFKGLIGAIVGLAFIRLMWTQSLYQSCLTKLSGHYVQSEHLLYRLRDSEIKRIASLKGLEITLYIESQTSFRWQFLRSLYPRND